MTLRHALLVPLVLTLASFARGQSLAQIRLDGSLDGAGRVEIEVGAMVKGQARVLEVGVFLGHGTSGADVIRLLSGRLETAGMQSYRGGEASKPAAHSGSIFVEQALFVNMRLGDGIEGTVTACEGAPESLKVVAPDKGGADIELLLQANAIHPVTRQSKTVSLEVPLTAGSHPVQNCEALMEAAVKAKWGCDRPKTDLWRPLRLSDGSRLEGVSVGVKQGYRVEVTLAQAPEPDGQ